MDIGACSTRPGASVVSAQEEWRRLAPLMEVLRKEFPGKTFSIDTFRAETVKRCFDSIGDFIVNDISAGEDSPDMLGDRGAAFADIHSHAQERDSGHHAESLLV